jgi:hypothetical protein
VQALDKSAPFNDVWAFFGMSKSPKKRYCNKGRPVNLSIDRPAFVGFVEEASSKTNKPVAVAKDADDYCFTNRTGVENAAPLSMRTK